MPAPADEWPELTWTAPTENFLQKRFREAEDKFEAEWGDLPQMPVAVEQTLRGGAVGPQVSTLRERLGLPPGMVFDEPMADKVERYRAAHGLPAGRMIDAAMIASLNRGYPYYAQRIQQNKLRASTMPGDLGERYVIVDTAIQQLYMYEGDRVVGQMRVVVGKASDQTPLLSSSFSHVTLKPYWNVPPDLTRDRYAARAISFGDNYLKTRGFEPLSDFTDEARVLGYREVDWKAVQRGDVMLRLRQKPGPGNGMGDIKFMFDNSFGVYLHDTPSKALFQQEKRAESAGCVRVERPWELAEWLYGYRPQPSGSEPEQNVPMESDVGVHLAYFTAIPTADGFEFRDEDPYGFDSGYLASL